jgi:hypothetical protein
MDKPADLFVFIVECRNVDSESFVVNMPRDLPLSWRLGRDLHVAEGPTKKDPDFAF